MAVQVRILAALPIVALCCADANIDPIRVDWDQPIEWYLMWLLFPQVKNLL